MGRCTFLSVPSGTQQRSKRNDAKQDEYQGNDIAYLTARQGIADRFTGYKYDEFTTHSNLLVQVKSNVFIFNRIK